MTETQKHKNNFTNQIIVYKQTIKNYRKRKREEDTIVTMKNFGKRSDRSKNRRRNIRTYK